jgi:hypothetical protein
MAATDPALKLARAHHEGGRASVRAAGGGKRDTLTDPHSTFRDHTTRLARLENHKIGQSERTADIHEDLNRSQLSSGLKGAWRGRYLGR